MKRAHLSTGGWLVSAYFSLVAGLALAADEPLPLTNKTTVSFQTSAEAGVPLSTAFKEHPPTVVLSFPPRTVKAQLPDYTPLKNSIVRGIRARYGGMVRGTQQRFLKAVEIELSAPFQFRAWTEAGAVLVDIHHSSIPVQQQLQVNAPAGGGQKEQLMARFLAMQQALSSARTAVAGIQDSLIRPLIIHSGVDAVQSLEPSRSNKTVPSSAPIRAWAGQLKDDARQTLRRLAVEVGCVLFVLLCWVLLREYYYRRAAKTKTVRDQDHQWGGRFVGDLVWKAFERQGYQLISEIDLPTDGQTLRVIIKEGVKAGLACLNTDAFCERQVVSQFAKSLRELQLDCGFLAATGSFTVPAQRLAKEHNIYLIGRAQLIELLSAGATSEFVARQLEQSAEELMQAKQTLSIYADELDTLRRQRNEASWHLGGERVKATKLKAQVEDANQKLKLYEQELMRWQEEVNALRKHWEESEWYLGESRARALHLEDQLRVVQRGISEAEALKEESLRVRNEVERQALQERQQFEEQLRASQEKLDHLRIDYDQAQWFLGEERSKIADLEAELIGLRHAQEDAKRRERALQAAINGLIQELEAVRRYGERRRARRFDWKDVSIELRSASADPVFVGVPSDISQTGMRVETDQQLPVEEPLQIRLHLPGFTDPVDYRARIVWQHAAYGSPHFQSGWQFVDMPEKAQQHFLEVAETLKN